MRSEVDLNIKAIRDKKKAKIRKIFTEIFIILVGLYLANAFIKQYFFKLQTDVVTRIDFEDSYEVSGFAIRDEHLLDNEEVSHIDYTLKDGDAVSKGEILAYLYKSQEDADTQNQINTLKSKKEILSQLNSGKDFSRINLEKLSNQIYELLDDIANKSSSGCVLHDFERKIEELQYKLNERQIVKGDKINFDKKLKEIDSKISNLSSNLSAATAEIKSPFSGNFASSIDGYEGVLDYSAATRITVGDLDNIENKRQELAQHSDKKSPIAKVFTNSSWFIACKLDKSKLNIFGMNENINLRLPCSNSLIVPAKIVAINKSDMSAAMILRCDYMNTDIAKWRKGDFQICRNRYSGLKVDKNAVHMREFSKKVKDTQGNETVKTKQVLGVYTLKGDSIRFKQIEVLHSADSYVICKENPSIDTLYADSALEVYDKIIIGGLSLNDSQ